MPTSSALSDISAELKVKAAYKAVECSDNYKYSYLEEGVQFSSASLSDKEVNETINRFRDGDD